INCCNCPAVVGGGIAERLAIRFGSWRTPAASITLPHHVTDV
ncbi:hypothetical protein PHMEG_00028116, partial [Phytophthora megakarya]